MKKFLSIFLALIMTFSCATVFAGAIDFDLGSLQQDAQNAYLNGLSGGLAGSMNLDNGVDVEALLQSGALDNVDMLGLDIDFLYHSTEELMWSKLRVSKADIALTKANINTYLSTALYDTIGDYDDVNKLVKAANATKIANFIGHILDPDFVDVVITDLAVEDSGFYYDSFDVVNVFYTKIARYSGLIDAIQTNWIDSNVNFSPILYLLNFSFGDDMMLGKSKLSNAERIAPVLIKSVIKNVCEIGPLEYILRVVSQLSLTYSTCMYEPIKALVQAHVSKGNITEDELRTLRGLLNLIINGNDKNRTDKLQFISAPSYRFASCASPDGVDTTTMFLYGLVYMTLVGKNGSNSTAVAAMKAKVNSNGRLSSDQKKTICAIYDGIIMNNLTGLIDQMSTMMGDNIDEVGESLWRVFINFFKNYWRNVTLFFNKLFDSLSNFGDF